MRRLFAAATIEDWYYTYKRGKFAALQNKPRSDKGQNKAMDPAAVEVLALRHPRQWGACWLGEHL